MNLLSPVAISNLYTKCVASNVTPEQWVGNPYSVPTDLAKRRLLARLIMEEAFETIESLGLTIEPVWTCGAVSFTFEESGETIDILNVVDGCCDLIYVATGAMIACGAPDLPHLLEVCRANDAKMPKGVVLVREDGKYLKPEGWKPPDHIGIMGRVGREAPLNLRAYATNLVAERTR